MFDTGNNVATAHVFWYVLFYHFQLTVETPFELAATDWLITTSIDTKNQDSKITMFQIHNFENVTNTQTTSKSPQQIKRYRFATRPCPRFSSLGPVPAPPGTVLPPGHSHVTAAGRGCLANSAGGEGRASEVGISRPSGRRETVYGVRGSQTLSGCGMEYVRCPRLPVHRGNADLQSCDEEWRMA